MTDQEEAAAISEDSVIKKLILQASADYTVSLSQYRSGTLRWDELQDAYNNIFAQLLSTVKTEILSGTGAVHAIADDYDSAHSTAFDSHIQNLLGMAQLNLGLSATQVFMPPLPDTDPIYPNLIRGGEIPSLENWNLSSGEGSLENGQIITKNPNGASFSQEVPTIPGRWYLISCNISGSYQGQDKYGNDNSYSGNISVLHANPTFSQISDELDEAGRHRRYFWVQASGNSMIISLSGVGVIGGELGPIFQYVSVRDLSIDCSTEQGQFQAMSLSQQICPPVLPTGSQEVGWYPQVEELLIEGGNLIDGGVSMMKNVDASALGNAGHPYWYFGKQKDNPVDKYIKIINGLNGAHGLMLPPGADPVTNGPVPIPKADYAVTCLVYVNEAEGASLRISFTGTNLYDGSQLPKLYQDFTNLPAGYSTVVLQVPESLFDEDGVFFRPSIIFENNGKVFVNIYNMSLIANSSEVYEQINKINPYNPNRSWYSTDGCNINYDFTSRDVSSDWAIALTGNQMFAAHVDDVGVSNHGIVLMSHCQSASVYDSGGVQSTQLIDPMKDFSLSVSFKALHNDPGYEPTFAVWTYGESQKGPDASLSHRNAPSFDVITEFDCEMGSDPNQGQPLANPSQMYMRPGSYIGYAAGGHNELLPPGANWVLMPNFWQKDSFGDYDSYKITMSGNWSNGHLLLTRYLVNLNTGIVTQLGTENLGSGPFSSMYVKIALENPDWNSKSHTVGEASLAIQGCSIFQGADIEENIPHKILLSDMDYLWFTPGGGGGISYIPFFSQK
ncbi:MAG: hypothetical protein FJZ58_00020 [Chlamydiae bacterium]|nr:hypothetical protein [Chlamydiota bacterium]